MVHEISMKIVMNKAKQFLIHLQAHLKKNHVKILLYINNSLFLLSSS